MAVRSNGLLLVGYSSVDNNGGDGIAVTAGADSGGGTVDTVVSQYVDVVGSDVSGNAGYGINLRSRPNGTYAATYQYLGLVNSTVNYNHNDGVHAFEIAYAASAANQKLYFSGDTISGNQGNGVYAVSIAVSQSFTEQYVLFGYKSGAITYVTNNGGDGIYTGVSGVQRRASV